MFRYQILRWLIWAEGFDYFLFALQLYWAREIWTSVFIEPEISHRPIFVKAFSLLAREYPTGFC